MVAVKASCTPAGGVAGVLFWAEAAVAVPVRVITIASLSKTFGRVSPVSLYSILNEFAEMGCKIACMVPSGMLPGTVVPL
jgi:hypothetical protein